MLTIKAPLHLKTAVPLAVAGEGFAQRLLAGQQTEIRAISPQQLLFLLGAVPEPAAPGALLSQTFAHVNSTLHQQLNLQVVNNLVNRILLSQSQHFTYQDNVYVTRALHQLGITNVAAFMQQIDHAMAEAKAVDGLVQLNRQDTHLFTQTVQQLTQELSALPLAPASLGTVLSKEDGNTLFSSIFSRLQTANIYQDIRRWSRDESTHDTRINTTELQLAEQSRTATSLPLLQTQNGNQLWQALTLNHHIHPLFSQWEAEQVGLLPSGEKAEAELAAASLLGLVTNVLHSRLEQFLQKDGFQVQLAGTAERSAENAVIRHLQQSTQQTILLPQSTLPPEEDRLVRSVQRIEQHNLEVLRQMETVMQGEAQRPAPSVQPDRANIMRDALRMMEGHPVDRLEALTGTPSAEISHPPRSAALQHILDTADPQTRTLYETLLQYQQDPSGALASGLLQQAGPGVLHNEVQRVVREQAETVHHKRTERTKTEQETSQSLMREAVLQGQTLAGAAHQKAVPPPPIPPPIHIVHRQPAAAPLPGEEQRTQGLPLRHTETLHQTETHTRQITEQQEQHEINRQVVATTTEDIVALVNKTLQRELNGLSDQVYSKMERRLQSERLRRGW